jgi:putative inorganic carbon (HCO3(-)) transporter
MGLVLVLTYIALNLLSPGDMIPSLAPYKPLLILAILSVPPLVFARLQAPEIGKLRTQLILVILFFGFACCSWFPHGWIGGNLITLLELGPNVVVYFMGLVFLRSPFRLGVLRTVLVLVAIYVIANAFTQLPYARASGESTPYVLASRVLVTQDDTRIQGLGMLHDPNHFGQYLLLILPMLFVSTKKAGLGIGYLLAIPITVLLMLGVFYTGSRGAEVGVALLIAQYLIRRFGKVGAALSLVVGSLFFLAINTFRSRTISMAGGMDRLAIWSDGMHMFKSSPLWGIGIRAFTETSPLTAHNSYLLCAAELGILGYFLWMSMIVVTLIQLNRIPEVVGKSNPGLARWAVAMNFSLSGYMFTSFFLSRTYDLPLFMLLGMSGAIITEAGGDEAIPLRNTKWPAWSLGLCGGILALIYVMLRLRVA